MYFIIRAIDKKNISDLRQEVRESHKKYLYSDHKNIKLVYASPLVDMHDNMNGTFIFIESNSYEEAEEFFKNDPYVKAGIFSEHNIHALSSKAPEVNIGIKNNNE